MSNPILHSVFPGAGQLLPDLFPAPQTTPENLASITAESEKCVCTGSPLFFIDLDPDRKPCWRIKLALLFVLEGSYSDF